MKTMTYSATQANFAAAIDLVLEDGEEVVITRAGKDPVVLVALAKYESLRKMAHLPANPANARRLLASVERLEAGEGVARDVLG